MRGLIGRCVAALLCSACTGPAVEVERVIEAMPEDRALVFPRVARPEAPVDAGLACPTLRVFADVEDLCARGILPLHPYGSCSRLPRSEHADEFETHAERVRIAALGGSAELFVKRYIGSFDSDNETVYLALRGVNGYVLLATVADYNSQGNDVPKLERFVGDGTSVTVRTLQEWWNQDPDAIEFSELRRETVQCTLGNDDEIRCNGECPQLAIVEAVSPVDCAAIASFDWSQLPRGDARDTQEDWGGRWDEYELWAAQDFLGIEEEEEYEPPRQLRTVEIEDRTLHILEVEPGRWALLHGLVPLLASDHEIRVGPGPGGVFVSSSSNGQRRIHRLHISTHELEPVLPGRCG